MNDWLDEILDRHPDEPVPGDFRARLRARLRDEAAEDAEPSASPAPRGRLHRMPAWAAAVAAAALCLGAGYWIGRGAPEAQPMAELDSGTDHARLEIDEIYEVREVLEHMPALTDAELELGFQDAVAGTELLDDEVAAVGDDAAEDDER